MVEILTEEDFEDLSVILKEATELPKVEELVAPMLVSLEKKLADSFQTQINSQNVELRKLQDTCQQLATKLSKQEEEHHNKSIKYSNEIEENRKEIRKLKDELVSEKKNVKEVEERFKHSVEKAIEEIISLTMGLGNVEKSMKELETKVKDTPPPPTPAAPEVELELTELLNSIHEEFLTKIQIINANHERLEGKIESTSKTVEEIQIATAEAAETTKVSPRLTTTITLPPPPQRTPSTSSSVNSEEDSSVSSLTGRSCSPTSSTSNASTQIISEGETTSTITSIIDVTTATSSTPPPQQQHSSSSSKKGTFKSSNTNPSPRKLKHGRDPSNLSEFKCLCRSNFKSFKKLSKHIQSHYPPSMLSSMSTTGQMSITSSSGGYPRVANPSSPKRSKVDPATLPTSTQTKNGLKLKITGLKNAEKHGIASNLGLMYQNKCICGVEMRTRELLINHIRVYDTSAGAVPTATAPNERIQSNQISNGPSSSRQLEAVNNRNSSVHTTTSEMDEEEEDELADSNVGVFTHNSNEKHGKHPSEQDFCLCGRQFTSPGALFRHIIASRKGGGSEDKNCSVRCRICGDVFADKHQFQKHFQQTHHNPSSRVTYDNARK